jgi:hypothetical protein
VRREAPNKCAVRAKRNIDEAGSGTAQSDPVSALGVKGQRLA